MPVNRPKLRLSSISARSRAGTGIRSVSFDVARGRVHGILGENLSGTSEVLAVIGGYLPLTTGVLEVDGSPVSFSSSSDAEALGIAVIRGEPAIVANLSVAENVFLGHEKSVGGLIRFAKLNAEAHAVLSKVGLGSLAITRIAGGLTRGERRGVELARALVAGRSVVLLDEPFSGLDARGLDLVLEGLAGLADAGVTTVVASYRLDLLRRAASAVTVLSRGSAIETVVVGADSGHSEAPKDAESWSRDRLIGSMTAKITVTKRVRHESLEPGAEVLAVTDFSVSHPVDRDLEVVHRASLSVREGEIVGLAGLDGSGTHELLLSLFGRSYGPGVSGTVRVAGRAYTAKNPSESVAAGLSISTDSDVKYDVGLLGGIPTRITPSTLARLARLGFIDRNRDYREAAPVFGLGGISAIVTPRGTAAAAAAATSTHNHRDALLRWLNQPEALRPKIVILDHPTRSSGPVEKEELRDLIVELAATGVGILLASDELDELLVMTTRIYTMVEGRITAQLSTLDATPQNVLAALIPG